MRSINHRNGGQSRRRQLGLLLALLLHGLVIAAILNRPPARAEGAADELPITASLLASLPVTQSRTPPKPLLVQSPIVPQFVPPIEALVLVTDSGETPAPLIASVAPLRDVLTREAVASMVPPRFDAAYLQNPPPVYPALARRLREEGLVLLRVLVTIEGQPERVELKTSSGATRLDQAAVDAVKRWRFIPARQDDQPVAAWVVVPISFSLEA